MLLEAEGYEDIIGLYSESNSSLKEGWDSLLLVIRLQYLSIPQPQVRGLR